MQKQAKAGLPLMRRTVRWIGLGEQCPADPAAVRELREAQNAPARQEARLAIDCSRKRPAGLAEGRGRGGLGRPAPEVPGGGWRKVIVFTGRRWDVHVLERVLKETVGGRGAWAGDLDEASAGVIQHAVQRAAYLTGEDSGTVRDAAAQAFMAHDRTMGPCLLVATGQSMGTGIDLHDADLLIEALLSTNPSTWSSARGASGAGASA